MSLTYAPTGSRMVAVLEKAWLTIREQHREVPDVVVITGAGDDGEWTTWGHYNAARWVAGGQTKPELFAAGELLGLGGRRVMETLLHEAAHALASARGIDDVSSAGRYHNQNFLRLAREVGLRAPSQRDKLLGYSECTITDATAQRYADTIAMLDAEKLPYVDHPSVRAYREYMELRNRPAAGDGDGQEQGAEPDPPPPPLPRRPASPKTGSRTGRDGTRLQIACHCRKTWVTPAFWEKGGLTCDTCDQPFEERAPAA